MQVLFEVFRMLLLPEKVILLVLLTSMTFIVLASSILNKVNFLMRLLFCFVLELLCLLLMLV